MKKSGVIVLLVLTFLSACGLNTGKKKADREVSGDVRIDSVSRRIYLETGARYASETGAVLTRNLTEAMKTRGVLNAISFCNVMAVPLTDSMSAHYSVHIWRVSDKPRNPGNRAGSDEQGYITDMQSAITAGKKPQPVLASQQGKIRAYYPIITNSLCLNCHGPRKQINPAVRVRLRDLYPKDEATGYDINQLRGLWVVEMEKLDAK